MYVNFLSYVEINSTNQFFFIDLILFIMFSELKMGEEVKVDYFRLPHPGVTGTIPTKKINKRSSCAWQAVYLIYNEEHVSFSMY